LETFGVHSFVSFGVVRQEVRRLDSALCFDGEEFFVWQGDFASAEATKGLSDRPLETFGVHSFVSFGVVRQEVRRLGSALGFDGARVLCGVGAAALLHRRALVPSN